MDQIEIPVHLDDSRILMLVSQDDFVLLIAGIGVGIIFKVLGWSLLASVGLVWLTGKYRQSVPDGHLMHLIHYYTGLRLSTRDKNIVINPFARRFIG